ncbi:MAG TPA: hypothetical protein ENJ99_02005, partial [Rhizobiales bacterium]|nr:hypothetical protein [Hyphomicrobiales bacterium]
MTITITGDGYDGGAGGTLSAGTSGPADGVYDGTATINGGVYTGASAWNRFRIGTFSDGELTINGGAVVETNDGAGYSYQSVLAGQYAGSLGIINVDGAGTRLYTTGEPGGIRIGKQGTGILNTTNGASVETFYLDIARFGTGTVNIDGAGSQLILDDSHGAWQPAYAGQAAFGRIGKESGSHGYLNITSGGLLSISNTDGVTDTPGFQIARNDGSYGKAIIDGQGSELRIRQTGPQGDSYTGGSFLQIGRNGQGILEARNNAQVNITGDYAHVAVSSAYTGDSVVDPASELRILSGADMTIDSGAYIGGFLNIAANPNSQANVLVSGAGSTLTLNGHYSFVRAGGEDGTGTLTVTQAGQIDITGSGANLNIGAGDGSGATNAQNKAIISAGGIINITSASNSSGAFANLGRNSDGNGYMLITGAGSQVNISSDNLPGTPSNQSAFFNVGRSGQGQLDVKAGGQLTITGG